MTQRWDWYRSIRSHYKPTVQKVAHAMIQTGGDRYHRDNLHAMTRKSVASMAGCSERTVQRAWKQFAQDGWLIRHQQGSKGLQVVFHFQTPADVHHCASCKPNLVLIQGDNRETDSGAGSNDLSPLLETRELPPWASAPVESSSMLVLTEVETEPLVEDLSPEEFYAMHPHIARELARAAQMHDRIAPPRIPARTRQLEVVS